MEISLTLEELKMLDQKLVLNLLKSGIIAIALSLAAMLILYLDKI